jgi:hypothetical protein
VYESEEAAQRFLFPGQDALARDDDAQARNRQEFDQIRSIQDDAQARNRQEFDQIRSRQTYRAEMEEIRTQLQHAIVEENNKTREMIRANERVRRSDTAR